MRGRRCPYSMRAAASSSGAFTFGEVASFIVQP